MLLIIGTLAILLIMTETLSQQNRQLYAGAFLKNYVLRSFAKRKPWWYAIRWLRPILMWFWPVYDGFSINGKLHISEHKSFENTLLIGKVGSGKTTAILAPTILRTTQSSLIITDTSELFEICSGTLKRRGYDVRVIDVAGGITDLLNTLAFAKDKGVSQANLDILIQFALGGNGSEKFWNENAKSILNPICSALANHPNQKYNNYANLRHCLLHFGKNGKALFSLISDYGDEQDFQEFKAFLDQDEKVIQSSLSTAKSCLAIFQDEHIQKLTSESTFELSQLRKKKTALFIKIPEGMVEPYRGIIALLYNAIFQELLKQPEKNDKSVFLILDEFANSGITLIPSLPSFCTQNRKKRVGMLMCIQDLGQLGELGANVMSTIVEGATATKIYLPGMSIKTAKYLESLIGLRSKTYENHLGETQEAVRPVYTADELKLIPHNSCIVESPSNRPAFLMLFPFYQNRHLRRLSKRKPVEIDNKKYQEPVEFIPLFDPDLA